jgi:hypothetical protein
MGFVVIFGRDCNNLVSAALVLLTLAACKWLLLVLDGCTTTLALALAGGDDTTAVLVVLTGGDKVLAGATGTVFRWDNGSVKATITLEGADFVL